MKPVFVLLLVASVSSLSVCSALRVHSLNSVSPQVGNEIVGDNDGTEGDSLNYMNSIIESDYDNAAAEINVAAANDGPVYYVKEIVDDDNDACINGIFSSRIEHA